MSATQINVHAGTRFFTLSTAGHVDHGKTSLLRRLTGIDPDRLKEEKERQMTTDLGFAFLQLESDVVLGFVDVPGHGKFLKNMLAGVGGIDMALLIVAADEGVMPQTRQHVRILSLLGISRAVVAITKVDLADEEQQEFVRQEVEELLEAHGMQPQGMCFVSSTTGAGIDNLLAIFRDSVSIFPTRDAGGDLFLPVDRVFTKSGFGTVITGTLVSGKINVGDQVSIEPGEITARVRRLESHGQPVEFALPGQRVACNLVVKDHEKLSRGHVIIRGAEQGTRAMLVSIYDRPRSLTESLNDRLSDQPIRLYHGTAEYHGYLRWVEDVPAHSAPQTAAAASATSGMALHTGDTGGEAVAFLSLQDPGIVTAQDRFVIRLTDDTIYGGVILLRERPKWLTKKELLQITDLLRAGRFGQALKSFLEGSPHLMLKDAQLAAILPDSVRRPLLEGLRRSGEVVNLGDYLLLAESRKTLSASVEAHMKRELEKLEDQDSGVALETLRQHLQPKLDRSAFQALLDEECAHERLIRRGDRLFLPGGTGKKVMSPELAQLEAKVREHLSTSWCLEWDELAELTGGDLKSIKLVVQGLAKSEEVVVAGYDFVADAGRIKEAHRLLADIWIAKRSIAPTDFREKLGTTRKYAMALLQYFDDQKITRRLDSGRVLLRGPKT